MPNFKKFANAVKANINELIKGDGEVYVVDIDNNEFWNAYLESFPEGTNPMFKERTEYDCQTCRQFIKYCGNMVFIRNNKLVSIWDIDKLPYPFDVVSEKLNKLVVGSKIKDVFLYNENVFGSETTMSMGENNTVLTWNHFGYKTPAKCFSTTPEAAQAARRTNKEVFLRSMRELTIDAAETIIELVDQNSLYRGAEFKSQIEEFIALKKDFRKIKAGTQDIWAWENSKNNSVIRNNFK